MSLLALLTAGCGLSHSPSDPIFDGSPDGGFATDASTGDDAAPRDAEPTEADASPSAICTEICRTRREGEVGCPFGTSPGRSPGGCEVRCSEVQSLSLESRNAFEGCVREDPLCFQSIDSCVYFSRYPQPVEVPVTLRGAGLAAFEGRRVRIVMNDEDVDFQAVIEDGAFSGEVRPDLQLAWSAYVAGYIDTDADGECNPDVDLAFFSELTSVGTFDAPSYAYTLDGPPAGNDVACRRF